jgi:hypothetical protein
LIWNVASASMPTVGRTFGALVTVAMIAAALAPSSVARADDAAESRFHDERGRAAYEARHFDQALAEFFEAARLAPSPRITFNIALCFDLLHRDDDAYLFFREYVASADADADRRRLASETLARLERTVARIAITSDPPGASVYVDQLDHGTYGVTPTVVALAPGAHTITLRREGYRDATVSAEATRGAEVQATGALVRIVGTLHVEHVGAQVTVREPGGGATLASGASPLDASLPPGLYEVAIEAPDHRPLTTVARVTAEQRTELAPTLDPLPPPTGDVTVTSSAAGAIITLDGEAAGFAPTVLEGLSLGAHHVSLAHEGLEPWEGDVTIDEGARAWLTVTLEEPPRTDRSPATWVVGGLGVASLLAGAVFGGLAIDNYNSFQAAQSDPFGMHNGHTAAQLREQGILLDTTADVLFAVGLTSAVVATVLYFVTEETASHPSRASFSTGER